MEGMLSGSIIGKDKYIDLADYFLTIILREVLRQIRNGVYES